ncbi:MAG: hypothetical protein RLP02_26400 [Coleofasciculus sp. C2-GNP5-27]
MTLASQAAAEMVEGALLGFIALLDWVQYILVETGCGVWGVVRSNENRYIIENWFLLGLLENY